MSFNTETGYLLWDDEHDAAPVRFVRENANSVVFDKNGEELVFEQATVVNLGSSHPPALAARKAGKHYISTDDSGASNQEYSLPPEESHGNNENNGNSEGSGGTTGSEDTQSGGRRKKGKGKKTRKGNRKSKAKKTKKSRK